MRSEHLGSVVEAHGAGGAAGTGNTDVLRNGEPWLDDAGVPIQAHGGWILPVEEPGGTVYWWYGEDKGGKTADGHVDAIGIRCYRSHDLVSWRDCGLVLRADPGARQAALRPEGVMERPRVLRCEPDGRYVMWLHSDDAAYAYAGVTVAVADAPTGPFEVVRTKRPCRQESRDLTLFRDEDGTAWLVHSSEGNGTIHLARLRPDCLDVDGFYARALPGQEREAPCLLRLAPQPEHGFPGGYAMLTSGCTGWRANAALVATSGALTEGWKLMDNPCEGSGAHTTFGGQATCVFMAEGRPHVLLDHWRPDDLASSGYTILPVGVTREHHPSLRIVWDDEWRGVGS